MKRVRVIISILFFIIAILRALFPEYIKFPNVNFDIYSIVLLLVGMIVLLYEWLLLPFIWIKKVKGNTVIKILIVLLCVFFIIVKMFNKDFVFDNTSLYLLIIAVIVIIIPDIKDFLLMIKKVKKGDFEIELGEKLTEFKEKVDKVEEEIVDNPAPKANYSTENDHIINILSYAASDPRGMLLVIATEIEKRIKKLSIEAGIYTQQGHITSRRLLKELEKHGVITNDIYPLFMEFWTIRNQVAHGHHYELNNSRLFEFAELGVRLLSLLPNSVIKE